LRYVTILGATGSIGRQAIAFLRLHRDKFTLVNIAVDKDFVGAHDICTEFRCKRVSFADRNSASMFAEMWPMGSVEILHGEGAAAEIAGDKVDVVLAAMTGAEGLPPVLAAISAGNRVALANKEALVCCGPQLLGLAEQKNVAITPVDSEHSAIFQSLLAGQRHEVNSLLLTASGGPFRTATNDALNAVTPEQAKVHPTWSMGVKNTIDSATLANKGLELIEAAHLFACDQRQIDVVINPSSVLHSAVSFRDGSMIAQLGVPDMRVAIGYGLSWPDRFETGVEHLSLATLRKLEFEDIDNARFPSLSLARIALDLSPDGPLIFNAANEVAVAAFVASEIAFRQIPELIDRCLDLAHHRFVGAIDDIPDINRAALEFCRSQTPHHQRSALLV
jgi:1-deoxy-D-xylulose-5-phosphate reductoisomerase